MIGEEYSGTVGDWISTDPNKVCWQVIFYFLDRQNGINPLVPIWHGTLEESLMNRKIYYWKLRGSEMQLGERTLIMGVLNITRDSFSDGGRFNDPDRAYARALELEEQGADIIDIGAESTKPGSHRITADEEWQRLVPVLERLRGNLRAPLLLDTYKSVS